MKTSTSAHEHHEEGAYLEHEHEELARIGIALSSTHDLTALLEMILAKTREITGADAGSLYIVESTEAEEIPSDKATKWLRFKLVQNDSRQFQFSESILPISDHSMAGYTAFHGETIALDDVYAIPNDRPFHFNPRFDEEVGYRTRSLLSVPMKNARSEVIGVMQLINCKRDWSARLLNRADVDRDVRPFSSRAVRLAESLASQAAVAYENNKLYLSIQTLFEGFVQAAAKAIEQRDPATSGHSTRVAAMTVALADAVNRTRTGPYADTHFSAARMKELRYATLLHDFGKIAVREQVLVKAKKLYPEQLALLQQRFDYVHKQLEADLAQGELEAVLDKGLTTGSAELTRLEEQYERGRTELDDDLRFILTVNETSILPTDKFERLLDISRKTYRDTKGAVQRLLTQEEVSSLSIQQGSLSDEERHEIEAHVMHSFNFLSQIPWTSELRRIPYIVRAHHEKLNGTGYPYRLRSEEIPVEAKMMIICDIFDALSSADRPYKKAVSVERALEILEMSVKKNELDADLFRIFVDARVFKLSHRS